MPAFTPSDIREKRPLTCDVCSKSIPADSLVRICTRCRHVRHASECATDVCPKCGCHVQRAARYQGRKIMHYV